MLSFSPTIRIVLTLCFMALLAVASLIPGRPQPGDSAFIWLVAETPKVLQKVLHVGLYGVLVLLWVWTLDSIESRTHRFLIAFMLAVVFGAVMEWYQAKVPGRFGTLIDVVLNAAGAALGLLVATFLL
ncbi:MAG: VanZ family protein [Gammaproteobacteria bacterium]